MTRATRDNGGSGVRSVRAARRPPRWLLLAVVAATAAVLGALWLLGPGSSGTPTAWVRFGTQDVHSLVFPGGDPARLLFGHHGGLLSSADGGRTWAALPLRDDAMSLAPAADGTIFVAGHEVFMASRDEGRTWAPVQTDLPSLDIHGFTRDPADPARMWAYLAIGGLWESVDYGSRWSQVRTDNVLFPTAVRDGALRLLGVDATGIVASDDGGRTWTILGVPATFPVTALAATPNGRIVYVGSPEGLARSDDGGQTWAATAYTGSAFAIATVPDGRTVAVVSQETELFRSSDAGQTWPGT